MAQTTPYVDIKDVAEKINNFAKAVSDPSGVFERTLKDMKSRAPGKVADAVRTVYNIKKEEITPEKAGKIKKQAGKIFATGGTLQTFTLHYTGRVLTPLHFGMSFTPSNVLENPYKIKKRKDGTEYKERRKYKVKAKVKGKKAKEFHTSEKRRVFLAPASKSSMTFIPWKAPGKKYDIEPIKTVSLPQMVDNPFVREKLSNDLTQLLDTRFNYHYNKHLDKELKG